MFDTCPPHLCEKTPVCYLSAVHDYDSDRVSRVYGSWSKPELVPGKFTGGNCYFGILQQRTCRNAFNFFKKIKKY